MIFKLLSFIFWNRELKQTMMMTATKTKGLMSKTISVHMHYKLLYISLPCSAKQEPKMTKSCVVWGMWTTTPNFHISIRNWMVSLHINHEHAFRAIPILNRSKQLLISLVKYKISFDLALSSPSQSSCSGSLIYHIFYVSLISTIGTTTG